MYHLFIGTMLLVLGLLLSGCMDVNRAVARLNGCKGDIYANPPTCAAPASTPTSAGGKP